MCSTLPQYNCFRPGRQFLGKHMAFFSVKNLSLIFFSRITQAPPPIAQKHPTLSPNRYVSFFIRHTHTNNQQQDKKNKNDVCLTVLDGWLVISPRFFLHKNSVSTVIPTCAQVTGGKNRHSKNHQNMDPQNLKVNQLVNQPTNQPTPSNHIHHTPLPEIAAKLGSRVYKKTGAALKTHWVSLNKTG